MQWSTSSDWISVRVRVGKQRNKEVGLLAAYQIFFFLFVFAWFSMLVCLYGLYGL